jgi:hypothetical protein
VVLQDGVLARVVDDGLDPADRHQVAERLLEHVLPPGEDRQRREAGRRAVRDHAPVTAERADERDLHVELLREQREGAGDALVRRAVAGAQQREKLAPGSRRELLHVRSIGTGGAGGHRPAG